MMPTGLALAAGAGETSMGRRLDRLWMKLTASAGRQTALLPVDGPSWLTVAGPLSIDYRPHQSTIATLEGAVPERPFAFEHDTVRYRPMS